jgi:hypothetical protein
MLEPAAESRSDAPSPTRLVIRVKLIPQQPPPPAWRLSRNALLLIIGIVAVPLGWLGISLFRSDSIPPPVAAPSPQPAPKASAASSTESGPSIKPEVQPPPDAPTSAINEVIPDVPRSALDTIRGTIRVSVRVTIDKQGTVIETAADDRGPSRYFERLAVESAKQWTFSSANSVDRRTMLVRFNFTRAGVTAEASPAQ